MGDWELYGCDRYGKRIVAFSAFEFAELGKKTNDIGYFALKIPIGKYEQYIRLDNMIEFRRRAANGKYELLGLGIIRGWRRNEEGITLRGTDEFGYLNRRIIAYPAGSAQAEKKTYADNIMKAIIRENFGASAITARQISVITVTADLSMGPIVSKAFAKKKVLEALQQVHEASAAAGTPIYFKMVPYYSSQRIYVAFMVTKGQPGNDMTGKQTFVVSMEEGNLAEPELDVDFTLEQNYIYAGGEGEKEDRLVVEKKDDVAIARSPFNRIELFVSATDQGGDEVVIGDKANEALNENKARVIFTGRMAETPRSRYGVNWLHGDKINAKYEGITFPCIVNETVFSFSRDGETITSGLSGTLPITELVSPINPNYM